MTTEKRMVEVTRYIASDGKEFDSEQLCSRYEADVEREKAEKLFHERFKEIERFDDYLMEYAIGYCACPVYGFRAAPGWERVLLDRYEFVEDDIRYSTAGEFVVEGRRYLAIIADEFIQIIEPDYLRAEFSRQMDEVEKSLHKVLDYNL